MSPRIPSANLALDKDNVALHSCANAPWRILGGTNKRTGGSNGNNLVSDGTVKKEQSKKDVVVAMVELQHLEMEQAGEAAK